MRSIFFNSVDCFPLRFHCITYFAIFDVTTLTSYSLFLENSPLHHWFVLYLCRTFPMFPSRILCTMLSHILILVPLLMFFDHSKELGRTACPIYRTRLAILFCQFSFLTLHRLDTWTLSSHFFIECPYIRFRFFPPSLLLKFFFKLILSRLLYRRLQICFSSCSSSANSKVFVLDWYTADAESNSLSYPLLPHPLIHFSTNRPLIVFINLLSSSTMDFVAASVVHSTWSESRVRE